MKYRTDLTTIGRFVCSYKKMKLFLNGIHCNIWYIFNFVVLFKSSYKQMHMHASPGCNLIDIRIYEYDILH